IIAAAGVTGLRAAEKDYISLFGGAWAGSGIVVNDREPWQVRCSAVGKPGANHLVITGSCSIFLLSVPISADVTDDSRSGRDSGIYTGGDIAATISGTRNGDTVDFSMTWSKPVGGVVDARLTIINSGKGDLRIVIDNVKPNDREELASDIRFSQK